MKTKKMTVVVYGPLDCYHQATMTIWEWLNNLEEDSVGCYTKDEGLMMFWSAIAAVSSHQFWEWALRGEPRVAYNPANDSIFFIFKTDNNGTTFLVSDRDLPVLKGSGP